MKYRREIDGLRAVAILPVILAHAEFKLFQGGFVGVDIFFVISGYLITSIIITDINNRKFSIVNFYDRRARRILPALFLVMLATTPFACAWMLPEELKNYGQSLVATALFSNNILLAITSGYWDTASMFKPLLHTWSLGVEEQYYLFFPLILLLASRFFWDRVFIFIVAMFICSLCFAIWGVLHFPAAAFYILPTRSWELLAGALIAYWLMRRGYPAGAALRQIASLAGLAMILFAVLVYDETYLSPGPWIIVPVLGAVLIIGFAVEGTVAQRILASPVMVGTGLISYSLYLWHQPLFTMARIRSAESISPFMYVCLIVVTFVLAFLTWRFVEAPFRNRSLVAARTVLGGSLLASLGLIGVGAYLNNSYGMYWRFFDKTDSIADIDKRVYNHRVFKYKTTDFPQNAGLKILVIGNSFGRDFVNMTTETFNDSNLDIVYSDTIHPCIDSKENSEAIGLFMAADVIVFASGYADPKALERRCIYHDIAWAEAHKKAIFYIGTKDFGYNLNWLVRLPRSLRANQYNAVPPDLVAEQQLEEHIVPPAHFVSLLGPVVKDGKIPVTDHQGRVISTDRKHVTKYGAIYFGEIALRQSPFGAFLMTHGISLRNAANALPQ